MANVDNRDRQINYLRLSVTDRCNLRCRYCMPPGGVANVGHENILSYEQLLRIAEASLALGIEKVRVTGGEPLVRKGVADFLAGLSSLPGLKKLVLSSNGTLLYSMAWQLKDAGVHSINVSMDSLDPQTYQKITLGGNLHRVRAGIEKALGLGLKVKINAVVMRGVNGHEILDFVDLANWMECTVRFIEYMPVLKTRGWSDHIVTGKEILESVSKRHDLIHLRQGKHSGPAEEYSLGTGKGRIGVITPMSRHFCGRCNRIRVTATGMARACLFSDQETDLKPYLGSADNTKLKKCLDEVISGKPTEHGITPESATHNAFSMAAVGG